MAPKASDANLESPVRRSGWGYGWPLLIQATRGNSRAEDEPLRTLTYDLSILGL